jgi:hypothetical protein
MRSAIRRHHTLVVQAEVKADEPHEALPHRPPFLTYEKSVVARYHTALSIQIHIIRSTAQKSEVRN